MEQKRSFLPLELLKVLCGGSGCFVFVDDLRHYDGQGEIPGCKITHPDAESHGLRGILSSQTLEFQSEWVLNAQNVDAQLRVYDYEKEKYALCERVKLVDFFPEGTELIITIGSEALRRFAPIFKKKADLEKYLQALDNFCQTWEYMGGSLPSWHWKGDMIELASFLYEANRED